MKRIGNLYGATGGNYAGWVYSVNEDAPTIRTGGGWQPTTDDCGETRCSG